MSLLIFSSFATTVVEFGETGCVQRHTDWEIQTEKNNDLQHGRVMEAPFPPKDQKSTFSQGPNGYFLFKILRPGQVDTAAVTLIRRQGSHRGTLGV